MKVARTPENGYITTIDNYAIFMSTICGRSSYEVWTPTVYGNDDRLVGTTSHIGVGTAAFAKVLGLIAKDKKGVKATRQIDEVISDGASLFSISLN